MNDCQKTQNLIVDAVDERLSENEKALFDDHIQVCPGCRNEYELDVITKNFIRHRLKREKTPADVVTLIKQEIESEAKAQSRNTGVIVSFIRSPWMKAAVVAFILVVAAFYMYIGRSSLYESGDLANDLMAQSVENYSRVLNGSIQPDKISNNVHELRDFFDGRVDFPVALKPMKDCDWVGAVMSRHEGVPLAHLVYKVPQGIIYVYQANWKEVKEGKRIHLPKSAIASLGQTGWFADGSNEGYSVVLWLYGEDTICAAVASMDVQSLSALFAQQSNQW
jgi:hypothetical protein